MPELPIPLSDFVIHARAKIPRRTAQKLSTGEYQIEYFPGKLSEAVWELSKGFDVTPIGGGKDSLVIITPHNGQLLQKIPWNNYDMPPIRAKKIYYLHKLFSVIFPSAIPKMHAAFGIEPSKLPQKYLPGFVVSRIEKGRPDRRQELPHIWEQSRALGIPVELDPGGLDNFMTGTDGNQYYVDQLDILEKDHVWEPKKLFQMMETDNRFQQKDIRVARMCVNRLKALGIITTPEEK